MLSVDDAAATVESGVLLLVVAAYLASFGVISFNVALAALEDRTWVDTSSAAVRT